MSGEAGMLCPRCGSRMTPLKYDFATHYKCKKCKHIVTSEPTEDEITRSNLQFFVGRVLRKLDQKTRALIVVLEHPTEMAGDQLVITGEGDLDDIAIRSLRAGDRMAVVGKTDPRSFLRGFRFRNLTTGIEGSLTCGRYVFGKFDPYEYISKPVLENKIKTFQADKRDYLLQEQQTQKALDHKSSHHKDSRSFEFLIADLFERMGYENVSVIGGASDKGVDLEVYDSTGEKTVIQCKHQSLFYPIKPTQVREFAYVVQREKVRKGYFVTSSLFSPECFQKENCGNQMILIDRTQLEKLLTKHGLSLTMAEKSSQ